MRLSALKKALVETKGATTVGLVAKTTPQLTGGESSPVKGRLLKIAHVSGIVNWTYERSVNNQRVREGLPPDFESVRRKWGARLRLESQLLPFVLHPVSPQGGWLVISEKELKDLSPNELYLELKRQAIHKKVYELDGKLVEKDEIAQYLTKREREGERQELENPVILRDYKLSSILELHLKGKVIG